MSATVLRFRPRALQPPTIRGLVERTAFIFRAWKDVRADETQDRIFFWLFECVRDAQREHTDAPTLAALAKVTAAVESLAAFLARHTGTPAPVVHLADRSPPRTAP